MMDKKQKTAAELQVEVVRLKVELKEKKKETLKKITNKKYSVKRNNFLILKEIGARATN